MQERTYWVENRKGWKDEYGTVLGHLPLIARRIELINGFIRVDTGEPLTVIDYGCAYGYYLQTLRLINPKLALYGVEIAEDAARQAGAIVGEGRVFWQCCGQSLPLGAETVDIIYSFEMVEHVADPGDLSKWLGECTRLLKPTGYLFISTPNCSSLMRVVFSLIGESRVFRGADHVTVFSAGSLRRLVEPHLRVERILYSDPFGGVGRSLSRCGLSRTITLVCRKYDTGGR